MAKAKFQNKERLRKKLLALPDSIKKEIRQPMERAAQKVVDLAVHLAPVLKEPTPERIPGALRNSIDWSWGPPPIGAIAAGGKTLADYKGGTLKLSIYAGNDLAFYARFVEFGVHAQTKGSRITNASGRNRKSKRNLSRDIPAQPFFFPAWRAYKTSMKSATRTAGKKGAQAVAKIG